MAKPIVVIVKFKIFAISEQFQVSFGSLSSKNYICAPFGEIAQLVRASRLNVGKVERKRFVTVNVF